ncbi:TetR/AcrR family transcriptional regulator [uncultured Brevibacterium sp.]|uniref:TetR/AcrR family transcriptional regulator n=1 Tax=uncultured Brevibacterium sp. TaxID=189678 RepID=UPI0025DB2C31|nr:TetR/AcrR family transcriptional regulator [uncultured Brevibacterium sp.]
MKPITSDGRSARWDEHRRRRHRELLRTVRHVVAEHGADLSMEQISARSGTTKTVLYRYFGDRSGLQAAMGDWAMHTIRRSLAAAHAPEGDSRAALEAMIDAFTALAAGSPEVYRFCDSAVSGGAPARGFLTDVTDLLCVRMGLTREAEMQWAAGALGFVRSCTEQWLLDPRDRHDFTTRLTTWLWDSSRSFMEVHR